MKEDLKGAIKNAMARGSTLEQAVQSLVNAGYNESDVRAAATENNQGAIYMTHTQKPQSVQYPAQIQPPQQKQPLPQSQPRFQTQQIPRQQPLQQTTKKKGMGKIIILSVLLFILLGALTITILYRKQIIDYLSTIL